MKPFYVTIQLLLKMEEIIKTDPLTGEKFVAKKSSQRFASPANRIKFNNRQASILNQERAFLDRHIHKNDLILKEIYVERSDNVFDIMWLKGKGLRFDATNRQINYKGKQEHCVYNFMLIEIEGTNKIKIIKI